MQNDTEM